MFKKVLSFFSLFTITGLVVAGGYIVLDSSIKGNSNFKIISSYTSAHSNKLLASTETSTQEISNSAVLGLETTKDQVCLVNSEKYNFKTNSIVEYLRNLGEEYSFESRVVLASKYGLENYRGTQKQNGDLIQLIRNNNVCKNNE